ncbi:O-acetyl-ADP-ribose deacetylase (regulator of RNase III) [Arcanobacterium wilhelmae]|uniref:O-acetyl-ADP-ribose deacetylase (Regulator of RNase III) n=1 Tax=Arcanobacterium wilhelmae TaxID=1803177 RepID=A0ABT9NBL1_9ACTO|nr:O-acetyl-ADP-ribose deacetylase [Arcanobacterium wilhelmae]MDP9801104.1 O-acetyl-ADP-ribose deacetylase (regulator of RNase III) [Arcanobacterium wilhelmae]WFN90458.1 O-acetyl-ADP-ribose deacetylase [Arcanobacterium wilhelmae]
MEIEIRRTDITKVHADAIVNAANSTLLGGGGVDGAIHRAGGPAIGAACKQVRATTLPNGLAAGGAVATTAGKLPATWVIHTVGPVFSREEDRSETLASCYRESLRVAESLEAHTIAFPLVSAGVYGWPIESAAQIAVDAIRTHGGDFHVIFAAFSDDVEAALTKALASVPA